MSSVPPRSQATSSADGRSLSAAVGTGDVGAFELLFREHYASLCRFAIRLLGDPSAAEDLVQNVFTAVWANRATWVVERGERAYLFGAVRNAAINHRRHLAIVRDSEQSVMHSRLAVPSQPAAPDEELMRKDASEQVDRVLASLPERCRIVMELRWRSELSYAEIAEIMGISIKGVENQLARGLERVRNALR
jgi:RNA polymerase sigma-70 factor (ECF subfamily)